MATLYVTEFATGASYGSQGAAPVAAAPPIASQTVGIISSSAQSAAFNAATHLIRVHTDAICSIAFGTNPVAAATTARMAAGQTEYFGVQPGMKIAVITNS